MGTPGKETTAGKSRNTIGGMIGFDSSLNLFGIEEYGARSGNE